MLAGEAFRGRALPGLFRTRLAKGLLMGTVIAFAVLRNIPDYPFTLLAPYQSAADESEN